MSEPAVPLASESSPVVIGQTDFTNPATIDVDEVIANISHAFKLRGHGWDASKFWPNVTVMALAEEVMRLRSAIAEHRGAKRVDPSCYPDDRADRVLWNVIPGAIHNRFDADRWQGIIASHPGDDPDHP